MKHGILIRLLFCVTSLGFFLYAYIEKQNSITELRLEIPHAMRAVQAIEEENVRLQYEVDKFENPMHLMELARRPEFSHLKHPLTSEIVTIPLQSQIGVP